MNNFFIPKTIKAGYQERSDTYSGKLAYVIYIDNKGKVRKETSWNSWRDSKIEPDDFKNEPMSGFVLNKKVGGDRYNWNTRQTYSRVYDPRGFEIEITIPNLLYILEHANSIKGKGLEGEFVYAWDGTELLLVPVGSPEYESSKKHSDRLFDNKSFKGKDMVVGATYLTKQNEKWIYLGRYPYYNYGEVPEKKVNRYFFYHINPNRNWGTGYEAITSLTNKIVDVVDEECVHNYAELMDGLEKEPMYSPYDADKFKYTEIPVEDYMGVVYVNYKDVWIELYHGYSHLQCWDKQYLVQYSQLKEEFNSFDYRYTRINQKALFSKYPPHKRQRYLKNGNIAD